jgi:hypothetical protein
MSQAPWQNPRILYTLIFVFLSGAVAGAITMRLGFAPERHRPVYSTAAGKEISIQRFRTELNLNAEQCKEFETVLDDFMMYYQSVQAQMDDVRATGKQRILLILNDEQKQKFEKMVSDFQDKKLR